MKENNFIRRNDARITQLYTEHYGEYFKIACAILKNHAYAEEAVHDALSSCIAIFPKLEHFSDEELHRYVRRAVCNRCKTIIARNTREIPIDFTEAVVGDTSINIAEVIEQKDLLEKAISSLSLQYRKCILYKDKYGFDNETVAKVLGVKTASINMIHKRAKDTLRRKLKELGSENC